jgi:hypothetical protein
MDMTSLLSQLGNNQGQSVLKPDTTADEQTPGSLEDFKQKSSDQIGGIGGPIDTNQTNPFGQFFGNLDGNLQSPSKQLGLGLLGQVNPYLPYAGLLAMGLLGPNKFGSK